jgi:arylsulfatase A-like enzyme
MDVNFIKMHNPTTAAPAFRGRSHLGDYSDSLMEIDDDIGRIMKELRAEAPNTIVILTADNGACPPSCGGRITFRHGFSTTK